MGQLLQQRVVAGPDLAQEQRVDDAGGLDEAGKGLSISVVQLRDVRGDVHGREAGGHLEERGAIGHGRGFLHETFSGESSGGGRARERDDSNQDLRFHVFAKHGSLAHAAGIGTRMGRLHRTHRTAMQSVVQGDSREMGTMAKEGQCRKRDSPHFLVSGPKMGTVPLSKNGDCPFYRFRPATDCSAFTRLLEDSSDEEYRAG